MNRIGIPFGKYTYHEQQSLLQKFGWEVLKFVDNPFEDIMLDAIDESGVYFKPQ